MTTATATRPAPVCTKCAVHVESVFRVDGMCCGEEVAILERRLRPLPGVDSLSADIVGKKLHVAYDGAVLDTSRIVDAVAQTGMRAWLEHEEPRPSALSRTRERLVTVSGAALAVGLALEFGHAGGWEWAAYLVAIERFKARG